MSTLKFNLDRAETADECLAILRMHDIEQYKKECSHLRERIGTRIKGHHMGEGPVAVTPRTEEQMKASFFLKSPSHVSIDQKNRYTTSDHRYDFKNNQYQSIAFEHVIN